MKSSKWWLSGWTRKLAQLNELGPLALELAPLDFFVAFHRQGLALRRCLLSLSLPTPPINQFPGMLPRKSSALWLFTQDLRNGAASLFYPHQSHEPRELRTQNP